MIMVSDKNENFRIYITTVFIQTWNKKVEKMGWGSQDFEIAWKGFVGWRNLRTTALEAEMETHRQSIGWQFHVLFK
jgi:hypothetical protein